MAMMKKLTRIRLINWHFFANETLNLNGSTLISGDNTAGKSTVLDAIQLVLTTNTRKFNVAANEKSNRDLKGYVRCKTGIVGKEYLRNNSVISNVALEFYEEKLNRYFVIGVHMTSQDEESRIITKWYCEECRLDDLSFVINGKPALHNEFRKNGNSVKYIEQTGAAKDKFKRRLGNLEDKFFDIIPKSLAFKPMDNVKDFINKFILPESRIDIGNLRISIETLTELEDLINRSNKKLVLLMDITNKYEEITEKEKERLVNDLMIRMAKLEDLKEEVFKQQNTFKNNEMLIQSYEIEEKELTGQLESANTQLIQLNVAKENNETSKLIAAVLSRISELKKEADSSRNNESILKKELAEVEKLVRILTEYRDVNISRETFTSLSGNDDLSKKNELITNLENDMNRFIEFYRNESFEATRGIKESDENISKVNSRITDLKKKEFQYPEQTVKLKNAIEKEFQKRGIISKVWITSELLEITDSNWQNAVEGYFNTSKFNLIVEPDYFDIALKVYQSFRKEIFGAGIVNTKKLNLDYELNTDSLSYVVHSENRYAKAYANYILGRVIRCQDVLELEKYSIAITSDCMLYQGYVVRNLDRKSYHDPYIGQGAFKIQLENANQQLILLKEELEKRKASQKRATRVIEAGKIIDFRGIKKVLDAPATLVRVNEQLKVQNLELKKASDDPNFIMLTNQITDWNDKLIKLNEAKTSKIKNGQDLKNKNENIKFDILQKENELENQGANLDIDFAEHPLEKEDAFFKYALNLKTKLPKAIVDGFSPMVSKFSNEKHRLIYDAGGIIEIQDKFNREFDLDYIRGLDGIHDYYEAKHTLESAELVKFEEDLKKAKENCEEIFKASFLAKTKENIENARLEFRNLNKALQGIYYGEDSYHFEITYDKNKESLYKMITADNNYEGYTLWSSTFQEEYREEMSDLFAKLTAKDDKGEKVLAEYTDYRNYLDYDIEVRKKDGTTQKFSKIYGEKSGGETQTPYYVAIAASFFQLYKLENTIRIILLDEAFDKMDDGRIASMMDFFNGLNLQVIIATPPAKVEVIGEKVSTILMAIRGKDRSFVHEYEL